jgi:predicted nucleotidyltransferase component of viral defense system
MEDQIMITKNELMDYSKMRGIKNLGQAEKDYFQIIVLFIMSQNYGKEMVFKGGTALSKCFGLNRFSEDLDFTCHERIDTRKLEEGLKRFRIDYEMEKKEYENGLKITTRLIGPLYIGIRNSMCKFIIDFSYRENVLLKPETKTVGRFLEEIPSFDVLVMNEREILAEKIRAIMTRTKARDVYDLWFLIERGVSFDTDLIAEKLKYYNEKWSAKKFAMHLNMKKEIWKTELEPLIDTVPSFSVVKKIILKKVH